MGNRSGAVAALQDRYTVGEQPGSAAVPSEQAAASDRHTVDEQTGTAAAATAGAGAECPTLCLPDDDERLWGNGQAGPIADCLPIVCQ
jgi:hypothetical protein